MGNKEKPQLAAERGRIDLTRAEELRRWTTELKVDEQRLKQIVAHVGDSVSAVRNAIGH